MSKSKEGFSLYKTIALALLVLGIVLAIWGISASQSLGSDISRFFTGSPTDKAIWMLVGGAALSVIGLTGVLRGPKATI